MCEFVAVTNSALLTALRRGSGLLGAERSSVGCTHSPPVQPAGKQLGIHCRTQAWVQMHSQQLSGRQQCCFHSDAHVLHAGATHLHYTIYCHLFRVSLLAPLYLSLAFAPRGLPSFYGEIHDQIHQLWVCGKINAFTAL